MRLRTFTAPDMPAAMKLVREALGDDAVILSSEPQRGKKSVTVTAAIEIDDEEYSSPYRGEARRGAQHGKPEQVSPHPNPPPMGEGMQDLRFEIQNILRFHNLPELFIAKLLQKGNDAGMSRMLALHRASAKDQRHLFRLAVEKLAEDYFTFDPLPLESPMRLMLVGPPGVGKTLTIARIAAKLAMDQHKPAIITTDNKRAGGIEQLQAFTSILGVELNVAATRIDLREQLEALPTHASVLIDTAGCNPYDAAELAELKSFVSLGNIEPVLVMPAGGDSLEAIDIAEAFMQLPIKRLLVTRADTARRLGGVLAAAAAHGLSFCNVSGSSSIVDSLQAMDGSRLAHLLLRYQLQT